jgi:CubicO group peptidase (beta-lactamase class C family)
MLTDQLTVDQRESSSPFFDDGTSWGLGLSVERAVAPGESKGPARYGWDGGAGTTWRTDTDLDLTAILFTQRMMVSPSAPEVFVDFRAAAGAALAH